MGFSLENYKEKKIAERAFENIFCHCEFFKLNKLLVQNFLNCLISNKS